MIRKSKEKVKSVKDSKRQRRKLSIRKKVIGTSERPRLCAIKTNKHVVIQVVDDQTGKTCFSVQTFGKNAAGSKSIDGVKVLAASLAGKLKEQGIEKVVFDRNGYKYTGIIAAIAESVRANGIQV